MTQLNDKVREAIIGNVGTIIAGRIGTTDAELMVKKFSPVFDAEDLTKLPNFESVASVMINNVPSSPFSMSLVPPLGKPNPQLTDALKRLSAAKYGRPRATVEHEIFSRLRSGDALAASEQQQAAPVAQGAVSGQPASTTATLSAGASGSSFLDEWLAKRKKQQVAQQQPAQAPQPVPPPPAPAQAAFSPEPLPEAPVSPVPPERQQDVASSPIAPPAQVPSQNDATPVTKQVESTTLKINRDVPQEQPSPEAAAKSDSSTDTLDEIFIDVRGNMHHTNGDTAPKP